MKLRLGTVQFGMDYGVIGQKKPELDYCVNCLDYATQNGITAIDTAEAYGTAQEVVGAFLKKKTIPRYNLDISTKFKPNVLDDVSPKDYKKVILERLQDTLRVLHTDYVDAYLFHSARYVFNQAMIEALYTVVETGLARSVGASVYEPAEALECIRNPLIKFTQFPYSLFDHRMKDAGVFAAAAGSDCNIEVRSAFIQGLILLDEAEVPEFLAEAKPIIKKLKKIAEETGISRVALAMAYIKREQVVSHLVFGVDNIEQLKEDLELFDQDIPADVLSIMDKEFAGIKAEVVMPSLWKR